MGPRWAALDSAAVAVVLALNLLSVPVVLVLAPLVLGSPRRARHPRACGRARRLVVTGSLLLIALLHEDYRRARPRHRARGRAGRRRARRGLATPRVRWEDGAQVVELGGRRDPLRGARVRRHRRDPRRAGRGRHRPGRAVPLGQPAPWLRRRSPRRPRAAAEIQNAGLARAPRTRTPSASAPSAPSRSRTPSAPPASCAELIARRRPCPASSCPPASAAPTSATTATSRSGRPPRTPARSSSSTRRHVALRRGRLRRALPVEPRRQPDRDDHHRRPHGHVGRASSAIPSLRVVLAHGGGTILSLRGRLRHGHEHVAAAGTRAAASRPMDVAAALLLRHRHLRRRPRRASSSPSPAPTTSCSAPTTRSTWATRGPSTPCAPPGWTPRRGAAPSSAATPSACSASPTHRQEPAHDARPPTSSSPARATTA